MKPYYLQIRKKLLENKFASIDETRRLSNSLWEIHALSKKLEHAYFCDINSALKKKSASKLLTALVKYDVQLWEFQYLFLKPARKVINQVTNRLDRIVDAKSKLKRGNRLTRRLS